MNPQAVWTDFSAQMRMQFRSKHTVFWSLAFPIMLMLLFGAIFAESDEISVTLYVRDEDNTLTSGMLCDNLSEVIQFRDFFRTLMNH